MKVNLLDEGIDQYLVLARFGPIPKYYGQPVVIGAFSIITQNVRDECVARHSLWIHDPSSQ